MIRKISKTSLRVNPLECVSTGVFLYSLYLLSLKELENEEHQNTWQIYLKLQVSSMLKHMLNLEHMINHIPGPWSN